MASAPQVGEGPGLGDVVGCYRLEERLGVWPSTGAARTGRLYLGRHVRLNRPAAVRILEPGLKTKSTPFRAFLADVRRMAEVRHPNIVDVTGIHIVGKSRRVALIAEYVEGPSLDGVEGRRLSLDQVLGIALQLLSALRAAHRRGVSHGQLRSSSALLTRDPSNDPQALPLVKLGGFGFASLASPSGEVGRSEPDDVLLFSKIVFDLLWGVAALGSSQRLTVDVSERSSPRSAVALLTAARGGAVRPLAALVQSGMSPRPSERPSLATYREVMVRHCGAWVLHRLGLSADAPTLPLVVAHEPREPTSTCPASERAVASEAATKAEHASLGARSYQGAARDNAPTLLEMPRPEAAAWTEGVAPGRARCTRLGRGSGSFWRFASRWSARPLGALRPFVPFLFSCALLALALVVVSR
ncbi:MAG: protein kinase [Deltaproteobacteria bacterium]|nr:protein kinase [Deltaproteobacteria bacterium]